MKENKEIFQFSKFKLRKTVQYSLIVSILLIQIFIGAFFYNEFVFTKKFTFLEKQLHDIHLLENLTDDSKKELLTAHDYLRKYFMTDDEKQLQLYFQSVNLLGKKLDSINLYKEKIPRLKNVFVDKRKDSFNIGKLKSMIDSTYEYSISSPLKLNKDVPKIIKFKNNFQLDQYDVETKTFSDTLIKKGLFGRLGDAISGKVNIRKDSTVVTVKNGKNPDFVKIENELDSVVNLVDKHYVQEVKKIEFNGRENKDKEQKYYSIFNNLLVYSTYLLDIYDHYIKDSKIDLEKEYAIQNSYNNKIRKYLVLGLMILMFFVSVLIMYFTRLAFIYEQKLKKANQQIIENLNFKNRILGMLSHELRSPLKIIGIFINRITKKTTDLTIKEYLKSISFTNNTLLMQANQILEYTKNQRIENKLVPIKFNLSNEISSIINAIEPYIENRNNQFNTIISIEDNLWIYSDNTKINQIFMNILGNANKFTENGIIQVSVNIVKNNDYSVIMETIIKDNGVGISKSDLEKIFEPYYQGVLSENVENLGAGLGLSLCKEIIDLYHGKITVESEINNGTIVQFSLNLKKDESRKE